MPALGSSLDEFKHAYGPAVGERAQSDLYPSSYDFTDGQATLTATLLLGRVVHLGILFEESPAAAVTWLLERYSGRSGWRRLPNTDARFARHYPAFNPNGERNQLHATAGNVALVQHGVGLGELVLWIEEDAYPELLSEHRRGRRS